MRGIAPGALSAPPSRGRHRPAINSQRPTATTPAAGSQGVTRRKGYASAALPHPCARVIVLPSRPPGMGCSGHLGWGGSPAAAVAIGPGFSSRSPLISSGSCLPSRASPGAAFPRAAVPIGPGCPSCPLLFPWALAESFWPHWHPCQSPRPGPKQVFSRMRLVRLFAYP